MEENPQIVPEDQHIPLPFPLLVANTGSHLVLAEIKENKGAILAILETQTNNFVAEGAIEFNAPPIGMEISTFWTEALQHAAREMLAGLDKRLATPKRKLVVVGGK